MSMFRPKKLELSGFVNTMALRDYSKRKAFEKHEPERYGTTPRRFSLVAFRDVFQNHRIQ